MIETIMLLSWIFHFFVAFVLSSNSILGIVMKFGSFILGIGMILLYLQTTGIVEGVKLI